MPQFRFNPNPTHNESDKTFAPVPQIKARVQLRGQIKPRPLRALGPLFERHKPVVPDKSYRNFFAAVSKRVNYNDRRVFDKDIVSGFKRATDTLPAYKEKITWTRELFEDWVVKFAPEKQKRMVKAVEDFYVTATKNTDYSTKDLFAKVEALLVGHKPGWAPRIIFKSTDLYNAFAGPVAAAVMERFNSRLKKSNSRHRYALAYKAQPDNFLQFLDSHKGEFFDVPSYLESDFSGNDKTQTSSVVFTFGHFLRRMGVSETFIRLETRAMLSYSVKSPQYGFRATVENELATGSVFTTLRNCWLNFSIHRSFLFTVPTICSSRTLILGDDMLCSFHGKVSYLTKKYDSHASRCYMVCSSVRTKGVQNHNFLSKSLFRDWRGKIWCAPLLGKALARFNVRANPNDGVPDDAYMFMKSMSYAYEFRYIEIFRDLFSERALLHADKAREFFNRHSADSQIVLQLEAEIVSWQYRQRGARLKGLVATLNSFECVEEMAYVIFLERRYGCSFEDLLREVRRFVLGTSPCGVDNIVLELLAGDFV